ncbi:hypothetical protein WJR50_24555 [Catalinimonas sp. 4WD22]|uniref:hypothetical protein n=1 Tax=Catalinimonas locisalis TaxID=3133978 RepID=UPI0031017B06
MMGQLLYLKNHEIDREKWDKCIEESPQGVIYALSWYLDFCDSEWEAVVEIKDEQYLTVMPIQLKKKYNFTFIHQDLYTFVLGVFSVKEGFSRKDFWQCVNTAFSKFRYIAKYRFNTDNNCFFLESEFQTKSLTHHLAIDKPYEELKKEYSKDRVKNLKRSQKKEQRVIASKDYTSLIEMFGTYTLPRISNLLFLPETDLKLFELADQLGFSELYLVVDNLGNKLAGGIFLKFKDRITVIYGSTTDKGKKYSSRTLLMDYVINKYANSIYTILDFTGGNHPGVAHFKKGFGAKELVINEVQISKFPKLINEANAVRRKFIRKYLVR